MILLYRGDCYCFVVVIMGAIVSMVVLMLYWYPVYQTTHQVRDAAITHHASPILQRSISQLDWTPAVRSMGVLARQTRTFSNPLSAQLSGCLALSSCIGPTIQN